MNNEKSEMLKDDTKPVLPEDAAKALNMLNRLTLNLCSMADREATALAQNDMVAFSILQDEKALTSEQYVKACTEFRDNINAYRNSDPTLLDRLEKLQKDLAEKTQENNKAVEQMYERAKNRTQSSLLAAQEIGQNCHIRFQPSDGDINQNNSNQNTGGA